jgi:hypothetical protein
MKKNLIVGLDVSTKTIGCSVFEDLGDEGRLQLLTHVTPKIPTSLGNDLYEKSKIFENEFICKYKDLLFDRVKTIIIEEPLLQSNNIYTVGILLKFNGMISYLMNRQLNVKPVYISSYDARQFAYPELMDIQKLKKDGTKIPMNLLLKKEKTLFGGFLDKITEDVFVGLPIELHKYYNKEKNLYKLDKKIILFDLINRDFQGITWDYNKKGELTKENFDQVDAIVATLGYMRQNKLWK